MGVDTGRHAKAASNLLHQQKHIPFTNLMYQLSPTSDLYAR